MPRTSTMRCTLLASVSFASVALADTVGFSPADPNMGGAAPITAEACVVSARRLGENPTICQVIGRRNADLARAAGTIYSSAADCERLFPGQCLDLQRVTLWRPEIAGMVTSDHSVVLRAIDGSLWAINDGVQPRLVERSEVSPLDHRESGDTGPSMIQARNAPVYDERARCEADWGACSSGPQVVRNRFSSEEACLRTWSSCRPVDVAPSPESAPLNGNSNGTAGQGVTAPQSRDRGDGMGSSGGLSQANFWMMMWALDRDNGYRPRYEQPSSQYASRPITPASLPPSQPHSGGWFGRSSTPAPATPSTNSGWSAGYSGAPPQRPATTGVVSQPQGGGWSSGRGSQAPSQVAPSDARGGFGSAGMTASAAVPPSGPSGRSSSVSTGPTGRSSGGFGSSGISGRSGGGT
jgi:hypothetical protein